MTMRMADGDTIEFSLLLFFCTHMLRLKNIQINNIISSSHHTHVPRTILLVTVNIMIRLNIYNVFFSGILWIEMNTMFIQFGHYFFLSVCLCVWFDHLSYWNWHINRCPLIVVYFNVPMFKWWRSIINNIMIQ